MPKQQRQVRSVFAPQMTQVPLVSRLRCHRSQNPRDMWRNVDLFCTASEHRSSSLPTRFGLRCPDHLQTTYGCRRFLARLQDYRAFCLPSFSAHWLMLASCRDRARGSVTLLRQSIAVTSLTPVDKIRPGLCPFEAVQRVHHFLLASLVRRGSVT
jgi:hypothetical protein